MSDTCVLTFTVKVRFRLPDFTEASYDGAEKELNDKLTAVGLDYTIEPVPDEGTI